jgi:malonate decarboxylase beta subunit
MTMTPHQAHGSGFHELSPRERLAALLDDGHFTELLGPFDRLHSPWLLPQGLVPQSEDGVVVVQGSVDGHDVVGIAIEGAFEGGSIGEVGGAKIATALALAVASCLKGRPVAALLLLETGGVRLQEATLGLAAIAAIQSAIIRLRDHVPVIAVIAGPVGCFGGMSLAAELCTYIIGTPHGRLGMNGPEVIEQEAGAGEIDASDRAMIWKLVGCETRYRDGWIDAFVPDELHALSAAVRAGLAQGPGAPVHRFAPLEQLQRLRREIHASPLHDSGAADRQPSSRGRRWLEYLADGAIRTALETASVLTADVQLTEAAERAFAISIVPDAHSRLPRAASGEVGLEQAWALAACIDQFVADQKDAPIRRPILAVVDTPGQAYGRIEEERCISAAGAAAVEAYARARRAGHPVLTLIVGRAVSGAFLAHGLQSDRILALAGDGVSMYAMSAQSIARITRRTLADVQAAAAAALPMSFAIQDAARLGIIDELIEGVDADNPTPQAVDRVKSCLSHALVASQKGASTSAAIAENPQRRSTQKVQQTMRAQWFSHDQPAQGRLKQDNPDTTVQV